MNASLRYRLSHSQEVASRILQEVRSGRLLPGEKLGSIRQLAGRFGVGRQVILSATEILSTESIIIKRSRQGTYINPNLSPELVRERTKRIGFLNWQVKQPGLGAFSLRVYNEVLRMAPALNCEIFWQGMVDDLDPVNWFAGMRLDALLVTGRIDDALVALLQRHSIPHLIVGNYQFKLPANQLEKALAEDISGALRHTCQMKHFTRLGTVTNSPQLQSTRLYLAGAQEVAAELGLHYPEQWRYADAAEDGYAGLQQLLSDKNNAPDIIFMTARAFPEAARYLFEHHLVEPQRHPFLLLDYLGHAELYPYLVDATVYPEEELGKIALPRLLDIYYGRRRQPHHERVARE